MKNYLVITALLLLVVAILPGCSSATSWEQAIYYDEVHISENLTIDGYLVIGEPEGTPPDHGILAEGAIRSNALLSGVTYDGGAGLWVFEYGYTTPDHTGNGSFDLTGGAYDNLFTATAAVFEATDASLRKFIVIVSSGANYGKCGEITNYIDTTNVAINAWNWTEDFGPVSFAIVPHPIMAVGDAGHISMWAGTDGNVEIDSVDYTNGALFTVKLDAGADAAAALLVNAEANGYTGIEAIEIEYDTGSLSKGDHASVLKIDVDETGALGSDANTELDFINILTTDDNDILKHAIHVGQSFDTAMTVSGGTEENPDYGYSVVPDTATDRVNGAPDPGTAFLEGETDNVEIFSDDNDYILIGSDALFEAADAILISGANQPIIPEYYYSTGNGTWAPLIVSETTNGFTQSGTITFNAPAGWALSNVTVPAGAVITNAYYIKIVRTRNFLGSPPVESYFKTYTSSSLTDFQIRGDGTINPVEMADASAPNDSLYYSTDQSKLVYKDSGGVVRDLY